MSFVQGRGSARPLLRTCSFPMDMGRHSTDQQEPVCLIPQWALYQLRSNLPCSADQRGLHQEEPPGDITGRAGESATAAAIASMLMDDCAHGRGWEVRGGRLAKTRHRATLMCFHFFLLPHHRFHTFLVKKKKDWTCQSVHFMFPSLFCIDKARVAGFWGSCKQPGKKNCSLGSLRRKLQSEKYCSLLHGKCWINLLILLRSPSKLGGAQLHPLCTFSYLLLQEISFHGFTPLWPALCSPG